MRYLQLPVLILVWANLLSAGETISYFGYDDCIQITNGRTKVVLCPAAGGRVLEYSFDGKNALYLDPKEEGWIYEPGKEKGLSAGRFDIGPEKLIPQRNQVWMGRWTGQVTGERSARMTSVEHQATGVQLIRDFELAASGTKLVCRQTIKNISDRTTEWCHWSRTFALGNGVCVIPLSDSSRFPEHYVRYQSGDLINIRPSDASIQRKGQFLVISDVPEQPKLGMDSMEGWFAYLMKNDLMFVKSYPTYPERVYNEVASLSISIWYPQENMVELEPIGPRERLQPGQSASFEETWELHAFPFPDDPASVDPGLVAEIAKP